MNLRHEFVEYVPDQLLDGVIYVSIRFGTAVHLCACGCGLEVVTPLGPAEWSLIFDGQTVSLTPSIGNWSFPCKSHYWIEKNQIQWARGLSEAEIATVRREAKFRRGSFYGREEKEIGQRESERILRGGFWRSVWVNSIAKVRAIRRVRR